MNCMEVERNLTKWLAGVLALEIDANIFRGGVPPKVTDALGVSVEAIGFTGSGNISGCYMVLLLGRYRDRDDALLMAERIRKLLPVYSRERTVRLKGSVAVYPDQHAGTDISGVSANLDVVVRG